jgi:hypothetical protein
MVRLPPEIFTELLNALVWISGDEDNLNLILRTRCDVDLNKISPQRLTLDCRVQHVIEWCEKNGALPRMVTGVAEYCQDNESLRRVLVSDWWQDNFGPMPKKPPLRKLEHVELYATVCGITVGKTTCRQVRDLLGEPARWSEAKGKPLAHYPERGLVITCSGALHLDPPVTFMTIDVAVASELPCGLKRNMLRDEWNNILTARYGPALEHPTIKCCWATYEPSDGIRGNTIKVFMHSPEDDLMERLAIYGS